MGLKIKQPLWSIEDNANLALFYRYNEEIIMAFSQTSLPPFNAEIAKLRKMSLDKKRKEAEGKQENSNNNTNNNQLNSTAQISNKNIFANNLKPAKLEREVELKNVCDEDYSDYTRGLFGFNR